MDENHFRTFLEDQQSVLMEFDLLLRASQTGITEKLNSHPHESASGIVRTLGEDGLLQMRFFDACRRLADAYVAGDERQRAVLRELLGELPGVAACMSVPDDHIRTKIDGARYRLALIYESIKDLRPDPNEGMRRLERIRAAAESAGIDPNPALREIAEMSSDVRHTGRKSMHEALLFLLLDEPAHWCHQCGRFYSRELPKCPHCGAANPAFVGMVPLSVGSPGETGTEISNNEMVRYLPTPRLIGYFMFCIASIALVMMTYCQVSYTFIYEGYHQTRGAWSCKATILILLGPVIYFRSSLVPMAKQIFGTPRLAVTRKQALMMIGLVFGGMAIFVVFLTYFARALGW